MSQATEEEIREKEPWDPPFEGGPYAVDNITWLKGLCIQFDKRLKTAGRFCWYEYHSHLLEYVVEYEGNYEHYPTRVPEIFEEYIDLYFTIMVCIIFDYYYYPGFEFFGPETRPYICITDSDNNRYNRRIFEDEYQLIKDCFFKGG
jgi:hypothetical protein